MTWFRRKNLVNRSTATFAAAMVMAIAAVTYSAWLRANAASRSLLTQIIKYHESRYEMNRGRWRHDIDGASESMERIRSTFDNATQWTDGAPNEARIQGNMNANTWGKVKSRSILDGFKGVRGQLDDATLHENMTTYHLHMKFYYEQLLKNRVISFPPLPWKVEYERRAIEGAIRQRYGDQPWDDSEDRNLFRFYESEPPPQFLRQAQAQGIAIAPTPGVNAH